MHPPRGLPFLTLGLLVASGCLGVRPNLAVDFEPLESKVMDLPVLRSGSVVVQDRVLPDAHGFLRVRANLTNADRGELRDLHLTAEIEGRAVPLEVLRIEGASAQGNSGEGLVLTLSQGDVVTFWWRSADASYAEIPAGREIVVALDYSWFQVGNEAGGTSGGSKFSRSSTIETSDRGAFYAADGVPVVSGSGEDAGFRLPVRGVPTLEPRLPEVFLTFYSGAAEGGALPVATFPDVGWRFNPGPAVPDPERIEIFSSSPDGRTPQDSGTVAPVGAQYRAGPAVLVADFWNDESRVGEPNARLTYLIEAP